MMGMRDHQSDLEADQGQVPWDERPALGSRAVPWWGAVLVAVALTAAGTIVDIEATGVLRWVFRIGFVLGCVLAITLVKRKSLFGPMVEPPLVMILVPGPLLAILTSGTGGVAGKALVVGQPLISNFPVMAVTTVLTLVIGSVRMIMQRPTTARGVDRPPARRSAAAAAKAGNPSAKSPRPTRSEAGTRGGRMERGQPTRANRDRQPPPRGGEGTIGRGTPGEDPRRQVQGDGGRGGRAPGSPSRGGTGAAGRPGRGHPPQPPQRRPRRPTDER
ncbi:MAG: hypothetical protein JOZ47_05635 [Kutzneria sp.]|nr:hypothetical protein [Kutzneria sp.]